MADDEGAAAEKRKRELKGKIDYKFIQFDDFPRTFGEGVEGLYIQPVAVLTGGITSDDKPGPLMMDAANRLETVSSPYGVGSGNLRRVQGTYTKGATGSVGSIQVVPASGDVIYFMYGMLTVGGTRAGTTDQLYCGISGDDTSADMFQTHLDDAAAAVDEVYWWPSLGVANHDTPEATSGVYHTLQTCIPSISLVNEDNTATAITAYPRYLVELAGMANTETFIFALHFLSMKGEAVTMTVGTSDSVT